METFESYAKKLRKIERETIQDIIAIKEEKDRLKKLYETDKESWEEQMYELQQEIDKAIEYNKQIIEDVKEFYRPTKDIIYSGDTIIAHSKQNIEILKGEDK